MKTIISFTSIILVLCLSCRKPGCLGKAGPLAQARIDVSAFKSVRLEDNINLVLIQGNTNTADIEGPVNLIENITCKVTDGVLIISNKNSCRWARDAGEHITVRLTFESIDRLDYAGSGSVTNQDTLRLDALQIESYTGAGDIELTVDNRYTGVFVHFENASVKLHGRSVQCNTYTNSRGLTDLSDFLVNKMGIEYGGLADTYINVTDELEAIVYYKGNVFYTGDPLVKRSDTYSTGKLIKKP